MSAQPNPAAHAQVDSEGAFRYGTSKWFTSALEAPQGHRRARHGHRCLGGRPLLLAPCLQWMSVYNVARCCKCSLLLQHAPKESVWCLHMEGVGCMQVVTVHAEGKHLLCMQVVTVHAEGVLTGCALPAVGRGRAAAAALRLERLPAGVSTW